MYPTFVLADLYSKSALRRRAYSALPDAPVQSARTRRRAFKRSFGHMMSVRRSGRSPALIERPATSEV